MDPAVEWRGRLRTEAGSYARLALENIGREFPSYVIVLINGPCEFPDRPRDRTPVFFGSFDWHSCVEMHWVLVRLVDAAEYKRRQYPPGPKISQKNFGRDRRLPITNRWREPRPS